MIPFNCAPSINISGPSRSLAGETATLTWTVDYADQVRLSVDGELRSAYLAGSLDVVLCPGLHTVVVVATGMGGRSKHALHIEVVVPPVVIEVEREATVLLGDLARIEYAVQSARGQWLDAFDQREPIRLIPPAGCIEIEAALEPERIRICGLGHDGRVAVATVTIRAVPCEPHQFHPSLGVCHEAPPTP